ncbi:long tail fiber protein proximal connector [Erwinia phage Cronus]|uniref:Tail fiber protein n=1 Tax=Erwinia phage Cronus TaxID=2163633 RepID=A0A2S1GM19_9CAUD|nr:long tail fiber protein proximal connector [Erwinia phage Cronus]AWD90414.1 putative tail fiber protein [Erwinia phage Cronus]
MATTNKNTMAVFGENYVQTQVLSENGAVKYKLSAAASNTNSVPDSPYLMLNDNALGSQTFERGLNVRVINTVTGAVTDSKIFDLVNAGGAATAFTTYMNQLTPGLLAVIISAKEMKSESSVDAWFASAASANWPGAGKLQRFPKTSYVAFYSAIEKCIIQEAVIFNDNIVKEDSRAKLEVVYDVLSDIGATGFTKRAIYDSTEYSSSTLYEFKRYPTDDLITPISGFGSTTDARCFLCLDMLASQELVDQGLTCRASLRWFKGQTLLSSTTIEVPTAYAGYWARYERFINVPNDADGYTLVLSRYPQSSTATGSASVRNVVLTRVSRAETTMTANAAFGVNGIRMNTLNDGSSSYMLELPDTKTDQTGNIYGNDFKEFDKSY